MKDSDLSLDRLLRAAATTSREQPNDMPYGFDTRVLTWAWTAQPGNLVAVQRLLRRVVLLSLGVIVLATAGVYNDLRQSDEVDSWNDEYSIADSAINSLFGL